MGVTFELPLTVSPVKQGGRVDFLRFDEVEVNEIVENYRNSFPELIQNARREHASCFRSEPVN